MNNSQSIGFTLPSNLSRQNVYQAQFQDQSDPNFSTEIGFNTSAILPESRVKKHKIMKRVLKHKSPEKLKLLFNSYLKCDIPGRYQNGSNPRKCQQPEKRSASSFTKVHMASKMLEQKRQQQHKAMVY